MQKTLQFIIQIPRKILIFAITLYQKTISPDHGPLKRFFPYGYCRFNPTCSQYGREVIKKRGILLGVPLTIWRVLRCNPWNPGGNDPVR